MGLVLGIVKDLRVEKSRLDKYIVLEGFFLMFFSFNSYRIVC